MLSVTTDYAKDTGCPEPYLRRIAEAGFSAIHWCHHWNTDFAYDAPEIHQIARWMDAFHLKLTDLHASSGEEKCWTSVREHERSAGALLVKNRIDMTARLGSDVIIMHTGDEPTSPQEKATFWSHLWKSLDELEPFARQRGVRIAIENGRFPVIREVLARYSPDFVGLCYDCGHGNLIPNGLDEAEALRDRLISVHLHDNDGSADQHRLLFTGTVDWERLSGLLANSAYAKWVSMEVSMRLSLIEDEDRFLRQAFEDGEVLSRMIESKRQGTGGRRT